MHAAVRPDGDEIKDVNSKIQTASICTVAALTASSKLNGENRLPCRPTLPQQILEPCRGRKRWPDPARLAVDLHLDSEERGMRPQESQHRLASATFIACASAPVWGAASGLPTVALPVALARAGVALSA